MFTICSKKSIGAGIVGLTTIAGDTDAAYCLCILIFDKNIFVIIIITRYYIKLDLANLSVLELLVD